MKKSTLFATLLAALFCWQTTNVMADELTVANDTYENNTVPIDGYDVDGFVRSQVIYPAADLADMNGNSITALKYYMKTAGSKNWDVTFEIRLMEVDAVKFESAAWLSVESATLVFTGVIAPKDVTELIITFDQAYAYGGGNLLVDIQSTNKGNYWKPTFYGYSDMDNWEYHAQTGYASTREYISAGRSMFTPKTTFTYESASSCKKPTGLTKGDVDAHSAAFTWTAGATETSWQYICLPTGDELDWGNAAVKTVTTAAATATGLASNTDYTFYVRAFCDAENQSPALSESFKTELSCYEPSELKATNVTATGANLTWTASGKGETKWQYVVAEGKDVTPDWAAAKVAETTPAATLADLTPATVYTAFVRSFCAENDYSTVISVEFTTECAAITVDAEHPWKENFNDKTVGELPKCWNVVDANETNKITIAVFSGDMFITLADNALRFNGKSSNGYGYALLPPFENELNTLQIVFSHMAEDASSSGKIELGYYANGEFQSLQAYDQSTTMKKVDAYPLTSVPSGARLAFGYKSNGSYDYAAVVDDIEVSLIPTCPEPTAITVSDVASASAKVAWTSEANAFLLQYRADEVNGWTDAEDVVNPFTLTGLDEQTKYWVRVKAVCGQDFESGWSDPVDFTTPCADKTIGYSEAFGETLDACWDNSDVQGTYAWGPYSENLENYMLRYATSNNVYAYAVLKTPVIALPADEDAMLQFDWQNTGVTGVTLKVAVDGAEAVDLSEELNVELNEVAAITKQIGLSEFAGKAVQFIFRAEGSANSKYAYLDNFQILGKICIVPKALAATPTLDGAIVTWQAGLDEEAWNLEYKAAAAEEWTGLAQSLIETRYTITGLEKATEYSVRVRAICDEEDTSEWTSISFTTLDDSDPTAVSNATVKATATKRIVNGQLIIERNGELFNAQGVNIR